MTNARFATLHGLPVQVPSRRKYEDAVNAFKPYGRVKDQNPEARGAGKALIAEGKEAGQEKKTFIYVNNRLEGNALETIAAMVGLED